MGKKYYIRYLLKKFIKGDSTPEEIELLIQYFQENGGYEEFPEVKEVLEENEIEILDIKESNKIFNSILNDARKAEFSPVDYKTRSFTWIKYAIAAVFIGTLGMTFYLNQQNDNSNFPPTIKNEPSYVILKTADGQEFNLDSISDKKILDESTGTIGLASNGKVQYTKQKTSILSYNVLSVPFGKTYNIELSDGSIVNLNSGSKIKFPVQFIEGKERKVYLEGEAFFDVAKNAEDRFIVSTGNLDIKVYGTRFNVSSYKEDPIADVVLVEGSVGMFYKESDSIMLQPNDKGELLKKSNTLEKTEVITGIYTAWIDGNIVFRNMSFENILKKLERKYNVEIINHNESLSNEIFNASFGNESIEKVLEYFKTMYHIDYNIKGNQIIIN